jgi:erythromycin esterase-like protein
MRESVMADNVVKFSRNNKAIVWAHNYHVSKPANGKKQDLVMGDYLD